MASWMEEVKLGLKHNRREGREAGKGQIMKTLTCHIQEWKAAEQFKIGK